MMPRHRVGLIGLGAAANKHVLAVRSLGERVEIAAAWSPTPVRRSDFAVRYGVPVVETAEEILDDASIDIVFVLSPPWSHLDWAEKCAERGKHVVMEKPVEATLARAERLVACCRTAGVTLAVVLQNRFRSPHIRLREWLQGGRLGRPLSIALSMRWWRPLSYFAENGRGMLARDGGGVLLSQAIHTMDQLVDLFGVPNQVVGFATRSGLRKIDTEDAVGGALRWDSGAVGTLDATTAAYPRQPERIDLAAENGSALLERTRLRAWLQDGSTFDEGEDADDPAVAEDYLAHRRLIADVLDAIDQGRPPRVDGASALGVHRLIDALLRSSDTGRVELT